MRLALIFSLVNAGHAIEAPIGTGMSLIRFAFGRGRSLNHGEVISGLSLARPL